MAVQVRLFLEISCSILSVPIMQRDSLVSSRLIRRSSPPESRMASWHASWLRSNSIRAQRAITVAVWLPPLRYLISFWICQYSLGRSALDSYIVHVYGEKEWCRQSKDVYMYMYIQYTMYMYCTHIYMYVCMWVWLTGLLSCWSSSSLASELLPLSSRSPIEPNAELRLTLHTQHNNFMLRFCHKHDLLFVYGDLLWLGLDAGGRFGLRLWKSHYIGLLLSPTHTHVFMWTTSTIKFIHMYMYAEYSVPTTCLLLGNKARH